MKYEKPEIEIIKLKMLDIITDSQIGSESSGSGDNFGGNGEYPWEQVDATKKKGRESSL